MAEQETVQNPRNSIMTKQNKRDIVAEAREMEYNPTFFYQLAQEYHQQAKNVFHKVKTEHHLQQYYTLIQQSIKCLLYLKTNQTMGQQMSLDQELIVTLQLSQMLVQYTEDSEQQAILHLDSFKNRLLSLQHNIDDLMTIEFMLICVFPLNNSGSLPGLQLGLKNCNKLLKKLIVSTEQSSTSEYETIQKWSLIFKFVKAQLTLAIKTHPDSPTKNTSSADLEIIHLYQDMLAEIPQDKYPIFQDYVMLSLATVQLENNYSVDILDSIPSLRSQDIPVFETWWNLLDTCRMIKLDENIYPKLEVFVKLFKNYKNMLNDLVKFQFLKDIFPALEFECSIFTTFNLKKLLLLFQSVSFMVNHHDPKNNHSTKFLPKLLNTSVCPTPSGTLDSSMVASMNFRVGDEILELTKYYYTWQCLYFELDTNQLPETKSHAMHNHQMIEYMEILQIKEQSAKLASFSRFIAREDISHELRTFSLINMYLLKCTLHDLDQLVVLEEELEQNVLVQKNFMVKCVWVLVWNMTHFKPFMEEPVVCYDNDVKNGKLEMLRKFLEVNVLKTNTVDTEYKIKKSQLCFLLLQYVGGKILINETEKQNELSQSCFKLATHCENITNDISYIIGLWCFNNSILLGDQKQELKVKLKLKKLVKQFESNESSKQQVNDKGDIKV